MAVGASCIPLRPGEPQAGRSTSVTARHCPPSEREPRRRGLGEEKRSERPSASPVWDTSPLRQRGGGNVFSGSPQPKHGGVRCSTKPRCRSIITCSNKSGQFQLNIAHCCSFSLFAATPSYLWGMHLKKEVWRTGMHLSNYNLFSFLLAGMGAGISNLFGAPESGFLTPAPAAL